MTFGRNTLLAGIAAVALAGTCAFAAAGPTRHTMTVRTPDGGVAHIEYSGNVPPTVTFGAAPRSPAAFFGAASPFAAFHRISAAMDREMDVLLRQADLLAAPAPGPMYEATLRNLPADSSQYSMVSTLSGNGVCMRSVEVTRRANGKPHIVSRSSGDCGKSAGAGLTAAPASQAAPRSLGMYEAAVHRPSHRLPMFHEAGFQPH